MGFLNEMNDALRCERYRTEAPDEEDAIITCPICGSESCDYIYKDKYGDIFGCDDCVCKVDVNELEIVEVDW